MICLSHALSEERRAREVNQTARKVDYVAAEQRQSYEGQRKLGLFNTVTCSQSDHIKTSVHTRKGS